MKKLTVLAVLALSVLGLRPAQGAYFGTYQEGLPYILEVTTNGLVSITILVVTTTGKLQVDDVLVFEPAQPSQTRTIPRNALRMIFSVDVTQNDSALIKMGQGTHRLELPVGGGDGHQHDELVIDIAP
jgi:hypothetical protein